MSMIKSKLKQIRWLNQLVIRIRWRERKVSYGSENSGKIYYVVRRHDINAGLFSYVATNLGSIKESCERGFIPVIDMMSYANSMLKSGDIGNLNVWELFFEQPCKVTLEDIRHSKNVILGSIKLPRQYPDFSMLTDPNELEMWREYARKYLCIKPELQNKIELYYKKTFGNNRVLGVLCRGTDYVARRPQGHPIQPDMKDVLYKCREVMNSLNCRYIYLATEDEKIWNQFQHEFPDVVFSFQQKHFAVTSTQYLNEVIGDTVDSYERNLEYFISIGILAKCNCLVAGATNGSYGALLLTTGYEYQYIYQLGRYEKSK